MSVRMRMIYYNHCGKMKSILKYSKPFLLKNVVYNLKFTSMF